MGFDNRLSQQKPGVGGKNASAGKAREECPISSQGEAMSLAEAGSGAK